LQWQRLNYCGGKAELRGVAEQQFMALRTTLISASMVLNGSVKFQEAHKK